MRNLAATNFEYELDNTTTIKQTGTAGVHAYRFTAKPTFNILSVGLNIFATSPTGDYYVKGYFYNGFQTTSAEADYIRPAGLTTSDAFQGIRCNLL